MSDKVMVSVCCSVYNHEKYLRKCLEGFVMQKTNFGYEVLIHDDASTDHSADIIREYEKKYPDIIKPIYQTENQYSKGAEISWEFLYPRAKGKYIALCEGDDYWCDENKLQRQFDELENNQEASFCVHKVRWISENGELMGHAYPDSHEKNCVMQSSVFLSRIIQERYYQYQTSSYFFRNYPIFSSVDDMPEFFKVAPVGDSPLMLLLGTEGDVIYLADELSHYRRFALNSFTQKTRKENYHKIVSGYTEMYRAFDKYTDFQFHSIISHTCLRNEFSVLHFECQYKKMLDKKYKEVFAEMSKKEKAYCIVFGYLPFLRKYYLKLRKRNE